MLEAATGQAWKTVSLFTFTITLNPSRQEVQIRKLRTGEVIKLA